MPKRCKIAGQQLQALEQFARMGVPLIEARRRLSDLPGGNVTVLAIRNTLRRNGWPALPTNKRGRPSGASMTQAWAVHGDTGCLGPEPCDAAAIGSWGRRVGIHQAEGEPHRAYLARINAARDRMGLPRFAVVIRQPLQFHAISAWRAALAG